MIPQSGCPAEQSRKHIAFLGCEDRDFSNPGSRCLELCVQALLSMAPAMSVVRRTGKLISEIVRSTTRAPGCARRTRRSPRRQNSDRKTIDQIAEHVSDFGLVRIVESVCPDRVAGPRQTHKNRWWSELKQPLPVGEARNSVPRGSHGNRGSQSERFGPGYRRSSAALSKLWQSSIVVPW